ncbi:hypothetical protein CDL12_22787 [Handroanthus impetiginosus]|uniref:Uncharacterized protein n=1 Tax=Handroanthus impetiginosus TaxID=429701 RepID=A0A2G9GHC4_9LAMI|nr:hypothetical protein CDL12_22787 [Handroanthus impetiginosus]
MGYYNSKIIRICISVFFILSLITSFACSTTTPLLDKFQTINAKETAPVNLLNEKGFKLKRKRMKKLDHSRTFSAMLPKGYVPPSGSSPCHNLYPNSVTFFCDLPAQVREKP